MAKDKKLNPLEEIRKELKQGKVVLGAKVVLKDLRSGSLKRVFHSATCDKAFQERIARLSQAAGVPVVALPLSSEEVGALCKKPFSIAFIGISQSAARM